MPIQKQETGQELWLMNYYFWQRIYNVYFERKADKSTKQYKHLFPAQSPARAAP